MSDIHSDITVLNQGRIHANSACLENSYYISKTSEEVEG